MQAQSIYPTGSAPPQQNTIQYVQAPPVQVPQSVVVAQQELTDLKDLKNKKFPWKVTCPMCGHTGDTEVEKKNGPTMWMSCLGVFMTIGGAGCCLIPFCIDDLKDFVHKCSRCNHVLGRNSCM